MAFIPMRLKPESGANRIKSADDVYSFMMYMGLSYRNKPHWQVARQALNHASASDAGEIQAWRTLVVALVVRRAGPRSTLGPDAGQRALLADPGLILEPDFDRLAFGAVRDLRRDCRGEVFLNVAWASSSACG
jgi:hypothetical protein